MATLVSLQEAKKNIYRKWPFLFVSDTVGNETLSDVNRRSVQTEIVIFFPQ